MVLWDIFRDFFVQYIFGGIDSTGEIYSGVIGSQWIEGGTITGPNGQEIVIDGFDEPFYSTDLLFTIGNKTISLSDWLSTTATIICLIVLVLVLFWFCRYMFRLTSGLFRGR